MTLRSATKQPSAKRSKPNRPGPTFEPSEGDELTQGTTHRRSLLQTMAAEIVGNEELGDLRMRAENGVAVRHVDRIMPSSSGSFLQPVKDWNAVSQPWPQHILEKIGVDVVVHGVRIQIVRRRHPAEESVTLLTKSKPGWIDHQCAVL